MSKTKSLRLLFALVGAVTACLLPGATIQAQSPAASAANQNQAVTDIIRLQHRTPDSIRTAIEPHLDPRGAISRIDNSLIVSTSRANLTQLQQLISELDIPRRQVRISVDFAWQQPSSDPSDAGIAITTAETTRQSIVVAEGESVWFQSGSSTPMVVPSFNEYGPALAEVSREDSTGFGASVELLDNRVILRIAMSQESSGSISTDLQNRLMSTTLELAPGEWFVLNAPPQDDSQPSLADTADFSDFNSFNDATSPAAAGNSRRTISTDAAQDLLAVRIELL